MPNNKQHDIIGSINDKPAKREGNVKNDLAVNGTTKVNAKGEAATLQLDFDVLNHQKNPSNSKTSPGFSDPSKDKSILGNINRKMEPNNQKTSVTE